MNQRVLVALSGGVDSSTVAFMLKEQGYEVVGVTFRMYNLSTRNHSFERGVKDAKILAAQLNFPYYIIDISTEFEEKVVKYFINEYKKGKTPNPCVLCNHEIKWAKLIEVADAFNCSFVATGHYAKINLENSRYYISEAHDKLKDQCFFLWKLTQEQLKRTLFPLGELKKDKIKKDAFQKGLSSIASKSESYNVCFIPDGDYRKFLNKRLSKNIGAVVLESGKEIDKHKGVWNFTLGQKKGFKNSENNLCVLKINSEINEIVVGEQQKLYTNEIRVDGVNFQKYKNLDEHKTFLAKVSYKGDLVKAKVHKISKGYKLILERPVKGLASGQSISLFEENDLVVGGIVQ